MRRWFTLVLAAGDEVAERAALWLPGALAWMVTVGWLALVIGVAQPPTTAELTFFGARMVTSGAWPWNAIVIGTVAASVVAAAFVAAGAAEAALRRRDGPALRDALAVAAIGGICAVPTIVALLALGIVGPSVARAEFNAPTGGDPVLRTALRLSPILVATLATAVVGAALHAAAAREALAGWRVPDALRRAPAILARAGSASALQAVGILLGRVLYLALAAILVRVLWEPIGGRLAVDGIEPATLLLLVGFVAIWLCLVLGGGALHAWGSLAWTGVLGASHRQRRPADRQMETHSRP